MFFAKTRIRGVRVSSMVVLLALMLVLIDIKSIAVVTRTKPTGDSAKEVYLQQGFRDKQQQTAVRYRQDFTYDRRKWDETGPTRIALLASTHKAASTTIQVFFSSLTSITVPMRPDNTVLGPHDRDRRPDPSITDWVWPVGADSEVPYVEQADWKAHAPFADFITEGWRHPFFKNHENFEESRGEIAGFYRTLLRRPWEEGKKLVIGAETFDTIAAGLLTDPVENDRGEETHVSPNADATIDNLLDVLPWGEVSNNSSNSSSSGDTSNNGTVSVKPLELGDIELHIHHRTPRVGHLISLWHEMGIGKPITLRNFILQNQLHFFRINSLAVAHQYARRGFKVTIVDMEGVARANRTLQEVAACEVVKLGDGKLCDGDGHLRIPGYQLPAGNLVRNRKRDGSGRGLTDGQMKAIDRVLDMYDCRVWQHLRKYQKRGNLRVLYPSDDLFATCDPGGSRDISYRDTVRRIAEIAAGARASPGRR